MSSPGKGWPVLVNCFGTTPENGQSNDNWELFQDHCFTVQWWGAERSVIQWDHTFQNNTIWMRTHSSCSLLSALLMAIFSLCWLVSSAMKSWLFPLSQCLLHYVFCCERWIVLWLQCLLNYVFCCERWIVLWLQCLLHYVFCCKRLDCSPGHSVYYTVCPAVKDGL